MSGLDLGSYLKAKRSPLADHVPALMRSANRHRIDPRFIVALAGAESSFGRISKGHNAWGIGPHFRYGSWEEGIEAAAKLLRSNYVDKGLKAVPLIGAKWAPIGAGNDPTNLNSNWTRNVRSIYSALGGDPNDVTKGWRKDAAPAAVAKLPSQNPGMVTAPPPSRDLLGPSPLAARPLLERTAFENLGRIARGESPTKTLREFTQAAMQESAAVAAAAATVKDTEPKPVDTHDHDEDSFSHGNGKPEPLKAGGGWGGSFSIAKALADIGVAHGLAVVSEKRDRRNTKSGGVSDHWTGSTQAYAFDISDGDEPTPAMDQTAIAIAAKLGVRYNGKGPLVLTTRVNGYRIQVLYRTDVGGNHYNHLHVGVRKL